MNLNLNFNKVKEKISSVDLESAGIGAVGVIALYGVYKGAKGIYHWFKGDDEKKN